MSFLAIARIRTNTKKKGVSVMIDNEYPLYSPVLMQENYFTKVAYGFRHSDPDEWISGAVGFAIDKAAKQGLPDNSLFGRDNPLFSRVSRINGIVLASGDNAPNQNT